jgi:hypothetical protein
MADNGMVAAGGQLTDQITLGVLAASVPWDGVDDAVAAAGRQARRRDGKRARHNSYRVKRPSDHGTRYHGPPTIVLVNLPTAA